MRGDIRWEDKERSVTLFDIDLHKFHCIYIFCIFNKRQSRYLISLVRHMQLKQLKEAPNSPAELFLSHKDFLKYQPTCD